MVKRAKKKTPKMKMAKKKRQFDASVCSHPGMTAMIARVAGCNKPPIEWLKQGAGSWLECFLKPDCTYGNCHAVDVRDVPSVYRKGG